MARVKYGFPFIDHSFSTPQVIARNPLDALFAEFNRVFGGNKTGYAEYEHLFNEDGSTSWSEYNWGTSSTRRSPTDPQLHITVPL